MITKEKKHQLFAKTLILLTGFFAFFAMTGCEQEERLQTQTEVDQSALQESRLPETVKKQDLVEFKFDEEIKGQIETRIADYKTRLDFGGEVRQVEKSRGAITVPNPGAGIVTIQDGVDAALPGGKVKVKGGTYYEDVLVATPGIEVQVDGAVTLYGSFTAIADDVTIKGFEVVCSGFVGILGAEVSGLEVKGNSVSGGALAGIALGSSTACTVKDNEVSGVRFGIALFKMGDEPSTGNTIKNNVASGNASSGIHLESESAENIVKDNICNSNGFAGVNLIYYCENNEVRNNVCQHNAFAGIDLYLVSGNVIGPNNTLTENRYTGMQVEDSDENTIVGNICDANSFSGMAVVYGSDGNEVTGNSCSRNGTFGVDLFVATGNTIGSGNEANDNGSLGIRLAFNTSDNHVFGNSAFRNRFCDIINQWGATGNTEADNEADCIVGF